MNLSFLHPFRYIYKLFTKDDSPKQLAFGVALGLAIGLIPKGNLVAAALTILLFAFRTNLGAGLLTVCAVSSFSVRLDPLLDGIGTRLLGNATVYAWMAKLYELPLVPWTALNNTVVMGGVILGAALFYPAYHLSEMLFDRFYEDAKAAVVRRLKRQKPSGEVPTTTERPSPDVNTPIPAPHLNGPATVAQPATPHGRYVKAPTSTRTDLPSDVVVDWRQR